MPRGPNIGQGRITDGRAAVHGPDRRQAIVVLPKNIGLAVAVEIGRCLDMPRGPNIGQGRITDGRSAVHGPDRRQAIVVLPKNIGLAVAVEVVGRYECGDGERRSRLGGIVNDLYAIARMTSVELSAGPP